MGLGLGLGRGGGGEGRGGGTNNVCIVYSMLEWSHCLDDRNIITFSNQI